MSPVKTDLALAYKILARLGMDDHTYTHLSARAMYAADHSLYQKAFHIYPFGLCFEEVTQACLLTVTLTGDILEGKEAHYNQTGYIIHGAIYQARPDVQAVFHLHTPATVAVSTLEEGLMPLSQWALHFYNRIAYHSYDALALSPQQGEKMAQDLGQKNVLLMRHHGFVTVGQTIHEALFYAYHLEQAAQTQIKLLSMNRPFKKLSASLCQDASQTLLNFEKDLGRRDFEAWRRLLMPK